MGSVENLVAPGGPCEGAQVVFQEDNAGPHVEGTCRECEWVVGEFEKCGWKIELQAPQGVWTAATPLELHLTPPSVYRPIHQRTGSEHVPRDVKATFREAADLE